MNNDNLIIFLGVGIFALLFLLVALLSIAPPNTICPKCKKKKP